MTGIVTGLVLQHPGECTWLYWGFRMSGLTLMGIPVIESGPTGDPFAQVASLVCFDHFDPTMQCMYLLHQASRDCACSWRQSLPIQCKIGPIQRNIGSIQRNIGLILRNIGPTHTRNNSPTQHNIGPIQCNIGPVQREVGSI